ncbi:MAG: DUF4861 family protein [Bacteroidales bacterium]|nr:DUF4861 family protein [Bacteroidales bacterium]
MENINLLLALFLLVISSCNLNKTSNIIFSNPLAIDREDEIVQIPYNDLSELIGEFDETQLPVFIDGGDTLTTQFIDYEKDGSIDDILIEINLLASSQKSILVQIIPADEYPDFIAKTNIRFAAHDDFDTELDYAERIQTVETKETSKILQMEGPAWENDKVGFRNYFDLRNGMDIFGKLTSEMALENVGVNKYTKSNSELPPVESYHEFADWGMDILKVGNSLGSGAIALFTQDSLYRIGDNGKGTFQRLYEGDLQSEFRFSFPGWKAGGKEFDIDHYVKITANSYSYNSSLVLNSNVDDAEFVTGIVNLDSEDFYIEQISDKYNVYYTHDVQAYNHVDLTLAIVAKNNLVQETGACPETGDGITQTYFIKFNTEPQQKVDYWFYAFWETSDSKFSNPENNIDAIRTEINKRENPIRYISE